MVCRNVRLLLIVAWRRQHLGAVALAKAAPPADLVLLDARILTVDNAFRTATALAVRDGRFVAVGSNEEVRRHIGPTRA